MADVHGEGIDFEGTAFRVEWLAVDQEPSVCNLSTQGRIPVRMRINLPDNARTIEDLSNRKDHRFLDDLAILTCPADALKSG